MKSLLTLFRCLLLVPLLLIILSVPVSWGVVRPGVVPSVQQSGVPIIAGIDPSSAEPGELITIHTKPPLTKIPGDLLLTFDGIRTEVLVKVGGDPSQQTARLQVYTLTAKVPEGLEPGTRPAIVLHAGKTESPPYRGFQVKLTPLKILSVFPVSGKPGDPLRLRINPITWKGPVTVLFDQQEVTGRLLNDAEVSVNIPQGPLSDSPVIVLKIGTRTSIPYTGFRLERPVPMIYFFLGGLLLILVAALVYWRFRPREKLKEAIPEALPPALQAAGEITYPAPEIPEDLVTACLRGECALYGGTGFSALAGFPAGKEFVGKLLDWAVKSDFIRGDDADALRSALQAGEIVPTLDSLAIRIQEGGHRQDLQKYLVEIFTAVSKPSESHRLLGRIGFSALITPNLDTLTETAVQAADKRLDVFSPQESKGLVDALIKRDFFILKLRGLLSRPETIILSPIQYRDFIQSNLAFREFMESLFIAKTFLFIGASLEEIEYFMDYTRLESTNRTHYAVVSVKGTGWKLKADALQRRYGIKVIPYTPPEPQKECLVPLSLLTERLEAVRQEQKVAEPARVTPPQEAYARLKRIHLENIGPFDMLDLELTEGWNVLLGDNGVGKSNILKGIALGILGRDAAEYADRMIKTGRQKGTITLETTTNQVYRTTLEKTSTGSVQISVSPPGARPLQTEGWLVVGYPPTRGVRWQRSSGPQPGDTSGAKVLEDLLPVLRGEPDFRLDDLKQLFINIDWFINKGDDEKSTQKYTKLRDGLVKIFNQVTLNMKLDYKGVSKTGEVFFDTDDGVVRIESLSQGTVSLMGWVGYLVRRIYDKYGDHDQPTRGYALVLIDEIDAHMHPGWQQSLVSNLKAIFPTAQVIATTHSPFIPITCEKGEVFLVKRDKHDDGRIQVVRSDIDFRLWRADQVLTSSLFGLESSRDLSISKDIEDYTELMTRDQLSEEDQKRMSNLASRLAVRPPQPFEREEARTAFNSIGDALDEKIAAIPAEKQEKIRREAKAQILESITRSRRPQ